MTFDVWIKELAVALIEFFKVTEDEAAAVIREIGEETWRESWEDGNSPREAAAEEAWNAMLVAK